jgi:hypothetical protein
MGAEPGSKPAKRFVTQWVTNRIGRTGCFEGMQQGCVAPQMETELAERIVT